MSADGRLRIKPIVIELNARGILTRGGVIHPPDPGPINGRRTHGTRLATGVQLALVQSERLELLGGGANGRDLGMRRGAVGGSDLIPAAGDDFGHAGPRPRRRARRSSPHLGPRQPDGRPHEIRFHPRMLPLKPRGCTGFLKGHRLRQKTRKIGLRGCRASAETMGFNETRNRHPRRGIGNQTVELVPVRTRRTGRRNAGRRFPHSPPPRDDETGFFEPASSPE